MFWLGLILLLTLMCGYLAFRSLKVPRVFRMLDLVAHGAPGDGPVHLLLISAAGIGFVWDAAQQGWI